MSRGPFQPALTISVPSVTALTSLTLADVPLGTVATTLDTGTTYVIGGSGSWAQVSGAAAETQTVLERAKELLGTTITKCLGTDFPTDQDYRTNLVGGAGPAVTPSVTEGGGVVTITTSASAARQAGIAPHGTINLIGNPRTERWYFVHRSAATTAVDAAGVIDGRVCAAAALGAPSVILGAIGSLSTGFFSYLTQNDGGTVTASGVTTVPIDTAYHVFEIWNNLTNVIFAIDGVTVATVAVANVGTNSVTWYLQAGNGATAAARTIKSDYVYICTGEPA